MSSIGDKKGMKRVCHECGTRFYDLNKRPIICPNCSAEFKGAETTRSEQIAPVKTNSQVEKTTEKEPEDDGLDDDEDADLEVIDLDNDDTAAEDDDNDTPISLDSLDDDSLDDLEVDDVNTPDDDDLN